MPPKYQWIDGQFLRREVSIPPDYDPAQPLSIVEVEGKAGNGLIVHYRQVHLRRGEPADDEAVETVSEVQIAILRELAKRRPLVVIAEDNTRTVRPADRARRRHLRRMLEANDLYTEFEPCHVPDTFSARQRKIAARGAAELYAALFPDVTLARSYNASERRRNLSLAESHREDSAEMMRISMEWRDKWAMREACGWLENGSVTEVGVVLGSDHTIVREDLPSWLSPEKLPRVISLSWPSLGRSRMDLELEIRDCKDPRHQTALVAACRGLTEWAFGSLLSDEARRLALPRLYVWRPAQASPYAHETAEEVKAFLLEASRAASEDIRAEILRMYEAREGIFAELGSPNR